MESDALLMRSAFRSEAHTSMLYSGDGHVARCATVEMSAQFVERAANADVLRIATQEACAELGLSEDHPYYVQLTVIEGVPDRGLMDWSSTKESN